MIEKVLNYLEDFPIRDLKPFPKNPRKHTQEQIDFLVKNIEKFGFLDPILLQKSTNYIICGHARLKALTKLGEETAPVFVWDVSNEDAMAHMIAENRSREMSTWDIPFLKDCLGELEGRSYPIENTGFTDVNVDCLLGNAPDEPRDNFKDLGGADPKGIKKTKVDVETDPTLGEYVKYVLLCSPNQREAIMNKIEAYRLAQGFEDHAEALLTILTKFVPNV